MMGSTQENGRTGPFELDGKRKGVKDRLRNIDTAMAWIKGELVSWRLLVGGRRGDISNIAGVQILEESMSLGLVFCSV